MPYIMIEFGAVSGDNVLEIRRVLERRRAFSRCPRHQVSPGVHLRLGQPIFLGIHAFKFENPLILFLAFTPPNSTSYLHCRSRQPVIFSRLRVGFLKFPPPSPPTYFFWRARLLPTRQPLFLGLHAFPFCRSATCFFKFTPPSSPTYCIFLGFRASKFAKRLFLALMTPTSPTTLLLLRALFFFLRQKADMSWAINVWYGLQRTVSPRQGWREGRRWGKTLTYTR